MDDMDASRTDGDIRFVQSTTLSAEWSALLNELGRFGPVLELKASSDGLRIVRIECISEALVQVDRRVMECLLFNPLYREVEGNSFVIALQDRTWWRMSVPYLLDPDGRRWWYRYEIIEAPERPGSIDR